MIGGKMKVFITGGAGFIGSHLVDAHLQRGDKVTIIDNLSTGRLRNIIHNRKNPNFKYFIDTIINYPILENLIKEHDLIYHLAAAVGVRNIIENPLESLKVNIKGTEYVLELCNKYKKKILMTSTSEIYGKSEKTPYSENDDRLLGSTYITRWGYSCSKAVDEFLALAYYREKKLQVIILRCFNTVGPRQTGDYGMVIPIFVKQALLGHPLTVYGDGKQTRCFSDVSDVVDGMMKLMESDKTIGEIFNIGNDEEISILDLAKKIKKMTNSKSPIEFIPYDKAYETGFEDMQRRLPDLTKINKFIGYKPKIKLNEMLQKIINYYER